MIHGFVRKNGTQKIFMVTPFFFGFGGWGDKEGGGGG